MTKVIESFSKLTKDEKITWLLKNHFPDNEQAAAILKQYWHPNEKLQRLHDEFTENTISNYYLPFSVAPNFIINGKNYTIPMVIEESSVIAAAAKAAKFWAARGGFKASVSAIQKTGQVHFIYEGDKGKLKTFFDKYKNKLLQYISPITESMKERGGGLISAQLRDRTSELRNYYQIHCVFETSDAMGANFINSCLEGLAEAFKNEMKKYRNFTEAERNVDIIMSILSNYTPNCLVHAEVSCKVGELNEDDIPPEKFAEKFTRAIDIAKAERNRAVTHNKGIMNGVDAVVLATGNDFRAVEAGVHSYAARRSYSSLTHAVIEKDVFKFWIEIPLVLGTVGGVTSLHPLAKLSLEMLGNPDTKGLMEIIAAVGLAQNFAAIRSLITTGIQKGHMKMHLLNILNQLNTTHVEKEYLMGHFKDKRIRYHSVACELEKMRKKKKRRRLF